MSQFYSFPRPEGILSQLEDHGEWLTLPPHVSQPLSVVAVLEYTYTSVGAWNQRGVAPVNAVVDSMARAEWGYAGTAPRSPSFLSFRLERDDLIPRNGAPVICKAPAF